MRDTNINTVFITLGVTGALASVLWGLPQLGVYNRTDGLVPLPISEAPRIK